MKRDFLIGLGTALLAGAYLLLIPYQVQSDSDGYDFVSGRTLPFLVGGFLLLTGVCLAATSLGGMARQTSGDPARDASVLTRHKRVFMLAVITVLYTLGITYIGYILSTVVVLVVTMFFSGERRKYILLAVSIVTSVVLYYFFHVLMRVPLPHTLLF